jgi:hypothetical protein
MTDESMRASLEHRPPANLSSLIDAHLESWISILDRRLAAQGDTPDPQDDADYTRLWLERSARRGRTDF